MVIRPPCGAPGSSSAVQTPFPSNRGSETEDADQLRSLQGSGAPRAEAQAGFALGRRLGRSSWGDCLLLVSRLPKFAGACGEPRRTSESIRTLATYLFSRVLLDRKFAPAGDPDVCDFRSGTLDAGVFLLK